MQFTPAQLKATFAPYIAATGRYLDVATMKSAQGPVPDLRRKAVDGLALAPKENPGLTLDAVYASLISRAERAGGYLGHISIEDLRRGYATLKEEARLDEAAGFTRQANAALKNHYAAALAGQTRPVSFDSEADAAEFAIAALDRLGAYVNQINRYGAGDPAVGGPFEGMTSSAPEGDALVDALNARKHDSLEAERMRLVIESRELAKAFDIEGPIFEVANGQVQINAFDIAYGGKTIVRSTGGGGAVPYRVDGTVAVDRYA